jgi:hypothetical protein
MGNSTVYLELSLVIMRSLVNNHIGDAVNVIFSLISPNAQYLRESH